jgi:cell pole-organizing protein PopZ
MSKVSMAEAAKLFDVSRPTLAKHLKDGKISGSHVLVNGVKVWQLDMAELKRIYQPRGNPGIQTRHDDLAPSASDPTAELQAEIRVLQAKLEAAEKLAEAQAKHLDDMRRMLPSPDRFATGARKWWPWA